MLELRQLSIRFALLVTVLGAAHYASGQSSGLSYETSPHDFRGVPYYRFFEAKDFDSSASATFITTAADGTVFYGDRNWVFLYDGATWHKVYQNSNTTRKITIMRWGEDGVIYAGGFNMIGEVALDPNNQLVFKEYTDPERPMRAAEDFQTIEVTDDKVYFQGRRSFASYDKATGRIDSHVFDTWVTASFSFDDAYHIVLDSNEVLRFEQPDFVPLKEISATLQSREITFADSVTAPNGDVILGSERRGLFRFDGTSILPAYPNFTSNRGHLLRDMKLTEDNRLILAFLEGGVIVLDEQGNTLESFDADVDHRFKSARSIIVDQSGTVWAMFNATIAKVLLDSQLTAIDERLRPSFFYASPHMQDGELYFRSFYILYKAEYDERDRLKGFRNALPGEDFEIWSVTNGQEGLYLNTADDGIFLLNRGELTHLIDSPAFDRLNEIKADPRFLVGANSQEIVLYRKIPGGLEFVEAISNPSSFINRMEEDGQGTLWLEYGLGAAGRIEIIDGKLRLDRMDHRHGMPKDEWLSLWVHEGEAYFTYSQGLLKYDSASGAFAEDDLLDSIFPNETVRIGRAFTDPAGNIWMSADDLNLVFWKNADGTYTKDDESLREMGEPYFEFLTFFDGGETLVTTAFELFHFEPIKTDLTTGRSIPPTRIAGISSASGKRKHFTYLGDDSRPSSQAFAYKENSLAFTVANTFSFSTKSPEFQYHLQGLSEGSLPSDTSPWTAGSTAYYTNLDQGDYTFFARARLANGEVTPWVRYAFSVEPPFYATYIAYLAYALLSSIVLLLAIKLYSRRLKRQNLKLERMVQERTREIESKNLELEKQAEILESQNLELANQSEEIQRNAAQLANALSQLRETQDQLLNTARTAGRAEVATNVLHNVGNVLNSINVSISNLSGRLSRSRVEKLRKVVALVNQHRDNLEDFLATDQRGRKVPDYLDQLAQVLSDEIDDLIREVEHMAQNVEHVKTIISTQQTHARNIGLHQEFNLADLIEAALAITLGDSYASTYRVTKDIDEELIIQSDKHTVLEILINIIKNAKESMAESDAQNRSVQITAKIMEDEQAVTISITDSGVGIEPSDLPNLFAHGFTTKSNGHGFGLHSCANAAKSLGGALSIESDGVGRGATATLKVPLRAPARLSA